MKIIYQIKDIPNIDIWASIDDWMMKGYSAVNVIQLTNNRIRVEVTK